MIQKVLQTEILDLQNISGVPTLLPAFFFQKSCRQMLVIVDWPVRFVLFAHLLLDWHKHINIFAGVLEDFNRMSPMREFILGKSSVDQTRGRIGVTQ